MSWKVSCAEISASGLRTRPAIAAMRSAGASFEEDARAEARGEIWAIVMEVRRRREHLQADASAFFHAFVQDDRADPGKLLAGRASAAEKSAAQAGRDQICSNDHHGDLYLS
jgi:hypothetical protein